MVAVRESSIATADAGLAMHPRNRYIKDPGLDATIQMQRQRVQRGLDIDKQKRSVAGISGGVLHKQLQLEIVQREIKILEEVGLHAHMRPSVRHFSSSPSPFSLPSSRMHRSFHFRVSRSTRT